MAEKVTGVNVEGRNYEFLAGQAVRGACTALATDWVKPVTLPEGTLLVDGLIVAVMFVNGTSVGWSGTKTVYSSDGENFFYDQDMTDPVMLPQPECYAIDPVQDDEYLLSCFPVVVYGTHRLPVCDSRGHYAGGALWAAGDTVAALYLDGKFMLLYSVVDEVKLGVSSPVSSNAVARDAVLKSEIADVVAVDNMYSVSSNAVAKNANETKSDIFGVVMYPRVGGGSGTTAQFLSKLVKGTKAPACCGSQNLTDGPGGNLWYNFIYIPHRNGINGDNYRYGTLILTTMTAASSTIWLKHLIDGSWQGWQANG